LLAEEGRSQEALEAATKAILVEPDFAAEAYYTRGTIWLDLKRPTEAIADFEKALQFDPDHVEARVNLASQLVTQGKLEPAIQHLTAAIHLNPEHAVAHYDLATALARSGRQAKAIAHYQRSIELAPTNAPARCNLGMALLQQEQTDAALAQFQDALKINPSLAQAHYGAAAVLARRGLAGEAITHLRQALEPNPDFPAALNELAGILATHPETAIRSGPEAVRTAERACKLTGNKNPAYLDTLAAAYAENGNFSNAIAVASQACELAHASGQREVEEHSRRLLELFRAGSVFRQRDAATH
jgi:tetratricopeptide (TPR) repeat protein